MSCIVHGECRLADDTGEELNALDGIRGDVYQENRMQVLLACPRNSTVLHHGIGGG